MKKTRYNAQHSRRFRVNLRKVLCFGLVLVMAATMLPASTPAALAQGPDEEVSMTEAAAPAGEMPADLEETMPVDEPPTDSIAEPDIAFAEMQNLSSIAPAELQDEPETATTEPQNEPEEDTDKQEDTVYTNSISGALWLDILEDENSGAQHGDGIRQAEEEPVPDYDVSLYKADDKDTAVQTVKTDSDGQYIFENLEPGTYVGGISTCEKGGVEYLLPIIGMSDDTQQFSDYNDAYTIVYSKPLVMEADTVVTDINAGLRTPMDVQPAANVAIQPSKSDLYVRNETKIGFGGKQWWVIGDSGTSTPASLRAPGAGSVTLLSDRSANFGTSIFNSYTGAAGNNNYNGSVLQSAMTSAYNNILTAKEKTYVVPRPSMDLQSWPNANAYNYANPINQNFWPLSAYEYEDMGSFGNASINAIRGISTYAWLRSPGSPYVHYGLVGAPAGSGIDYTSVNTSTHSVRPAFYFNLSSALFTSDASGAGMKSTAFGSGLNAAVTPTANTPVKLTMEETNTGYLNLALDNPSLSKVTASPKGTVSIDYSGARTGAGRSVSVMICNKDDAAVDPGKVLYYGRPVNCQSGNASGTATFTLPSKSDLPIGDYTLKIFNEEVNGANRTDYASTPIEIGLRVADVEVDLSASPATQVYYTDTNPGSVNITADITNHTAIAGTTIEPAQWFRVPVSNNTDYSTDFDSFYTSRPAADKGTINRTSGNNNASTFKFTADKNAKYWVRGTVYDSAAGKYYKTVSVITVDNLYKEITCEVRGMNTVGNNQLYGYETIPGTYGIPFDLDGSPLAAAPSLGFDIITLSAKGTYIKYGPAKTKSNQSLANATSTATVTLDGTVNADCDGDYTKYTVFYTLQKYLVDKDTSGTAVGTYSTLQAAVNACVNTEPCTITATADDVMNLQSATINAGYQITLTSDNTTRTIKQNFNANGQTGRHLQVRVNGKLTLKNIILEGSGKNYGTAATINGGIYIANGTVIMDTGSVITKCQVINSSSNGGGGAQVAGTGSLTMNADAKIVDNYGHQGGGVLVNGGTVTMNGNASISDNTAKNVGGGVHKDPFATFTMNAGEISGNRTTNPIGSGGGGISVNDFAQGNPAAPVANYYNKLYISSSAKVEHNIAAAGTQVPPSNYLDFSNSSIRGQYTFDGLLLDNDNINYRNPNYVVTYDANNGGSGTQKYYQSTNVSTGTTTVNAVSIGSGTGQANFTAPANHVFVGWTENSNGSGNFYSPGDTINISGSITLYAKWETNCEVTLSKTVTGGMGDKTRDFTFKITFEDSTGTKLPTGTQFDYTGGVLSGVTGVTAPAPGTLTLDNNGSTTIPLKHGQSIKIEGVQVNYKITIEETDGSGYTVKYTDSANPSSPQTSATTGQQTLSGDRTFAFENIRSGSTPGGFDLNSTGLALLIGIGVILIVGGLFIKRASRRAYKERH